MKQGRRRIWLRVVLTAAMMLVSAVGFAVAVSGEVEAQAFDVSSPAAYLIDARTGQVLFAKNPDEAFRPASLVKVMTLLVALDAVKAGEISLDDEVRVSQRAAGMAGSQVYLAEGEVQSLRALLKAVAIAGANDASVAVAEFVSGTEEAFVDRMNRRAKELGMKNSLFLNSHGLPPAEGPDSSWTSARDIVVASRELIQQHPVVLEWTSVRVESFREDPPFNLYTTNQLVGRYEGLDGLRTGYTSEAGYLMVATAKRGDLRLIAAVLAAETEDARTQDTRALLDYGLHRFAPVEVAADVVGELEVANGVPITLDVVVEKPVSVLVPRGVPGEVKGEVVVARDLQAPVKKGDQVADFVVTIGGEEVLRTPAYAGSDIRRAGALERMWRGIKRIFSIF